MWLLSTDRAELHFFISPECVADGYAALSHVWDAQEQSFQDIQRIRESCAKEGTNPRDFACRKIRRCCQLAESHGYKWVWIDTCCIDKMSSAELSEAINSMFRYYALAGICYGYLRDVSATTISQEDTGDSESDKHEVELQRQRHSAILGSIWFLRGWTLQELIAPRFFLFVSQSWGVMSTKADLAELLEETYSIPAAVLRLQVSHTEYSISQRMSWFGQRKTTRREDEAYCLLGIFGIHLTTLYGEGRSAFRRLQEALMRQSTDTTLFAWPGYNVALAISSSLLAPSPSASTLCSYFTPSILTPKLPSILYTPPTRKSPSRNHAILRWLPTTRPKFITFSMYPYGILAFLPIIVLKGRIFADLYWTSGGRRVLLCLEEDPDSPAHASPHPFYRIRRGLRHGPGFTWLDDDDRGEPGRYAIRGQVVHASWQEVLIKHQPSPHRFRPGQLPDIATAFVAPVTNQLTLDPPVRFDDAHVRKLMRELAPHGGTVQIRDANSWPADADILAVYDCRLFSIEFGQCRQGRSSGDHAKHASLAQVWARALHADGYGSKVGHDCPEDHVTRWPALQKTFVTERSRDDDPQRTRYFSKSAVVLSFPPCPISPERTLSLDVSFSKQERIVPLVLQAETGHDITPNPFLDVSPITPLSASSEFPDAGHPTASL